MVEIQEDFCDKMLREVQEYQAHRAIEVEEEKKQAPKKAAEEKKHAAKVLKMNKQVE